MLPDVARTDSNHRQYSEKDREWINFIKRLKHTNMPLVDIRRYALLREQGEKTEQERMHLLAEHAQHLKNTIKKEREHLEKLNEKIEWYRDSIQRKLSS